MMSDDLYIKMCLSLPENFFDGWEWQAGDKFIEISSNEIFTIGDSTLSENKLPGKILQCYYDDTGYGVIRPIPSQEQLFELISKLEVQRGKYSTPYWRLKEFSEYIISLDFKNTGNKTIKEFLLEYIMGKFYELEWDGEKWL